MSGQDPSLMQALQNAALYDHPVEGFRLIETHLSWVLLTGRCAYKVKKAVDLGFVDFTTLERRRFYCEEELRLNRRLAPSLYLGLTRITGSPRQPRLDGDGEAFEYAVRMAQFDPSLQFDHLVDAGRLTPELLACFAANLARFHASAEAAAPDSAYGDTASVCRPVMDNFTQLRLPAAAEAGRETFEHLRRWSERACGRLEPAFAARRAGGFVRECHGDLHLGNVVLRDGAALAFDCLEFDANLRWIDLMNEVAFFTMDLDAHGRRDLALRFLNDYLHHTGDYAGLGLLRFYEVYRALVRAKVTAIRDSQAGGDGGASAVLAYLRLARGYTRATPRALLVTHGLSGSGKTTLTTELLAPCGAIRVRSDVERKRLAGLAPDARSHSSVGAELYGRTAGERTYRRLAELAAAIVEAGFPALVDATFLKREQRDDFRRLAAHLGVPFLLLDFQADERRLAQRLRERERNGRDASDADLAVLRYQQATQEPLSTEESATAIHIDTGTRPDPAEVAARIRERMTA